MFQDKNLYSTLKAHMQKRENNADNKKSLF